MGSNLGETDRVIQGSPADWDIRFRQQARWTANLRQYFFNQPAIKRELAKKPLRLLEAGCGTGSVCSSLGALLKGNNARIHGLDIHQPFLNFGQRQSRTIRYTNGDVYRLPYASHSFYITVCHFLLLWLENPAEGLAEMHRVTIPGGWVAALAEPDYGGRIDHPEGLQQIGVMQAKSLQKQGADPNMGRKLSALFYQAGLKNIQVGVMGGQWNTPSSHPENETEWQVLAEDLGGQINTDDLEKLRQVDETAWQDGSRILFVPTFYAWGQIV